MVLPWLPATATPYFSRISSASISARGMTGIWRRFASAISGLSGRRAEETTTTSAPATCSAACPAWIVPPSSASRWVIVLGFVSEPETL